MLSKSGVLSPALSRRAALVMGVGGLATLASGLVPLYDPSRHRLSGLWDEIVPVDPPRLSQHEGAAMRSVPRRLSQPTVHDAQTLADWSDFRRRFVSGDGRIIDNANGGVSHSEGQGWGMMLAVAADDRASFDLIADWTRRHLQIRPDALHAWRYVPRSQIPVSDHNNATDGDLFIAGALLRAAWKWNRQNLADAAAEIATDILERLVREVGPRTVLLPGAVGFEQAHSLTINPSYYVLPLFEELASLRPSPAWGRLTEQGLALLDEGRFGRWRLSPDWLEVERSTGAISLDHKRPTRFAYDAIRIPLWLTWTGQGRSVTDDFLAYWRHHQPVPPAWVDLGSNNQASYPAPPGMLAIGQTASELSQRGQNTVNFAALPAVSASPDYYSAALTLLARCICREASSV